LDWTASRRGTPDYLSAGDGSETEFLGQLLEAIPTPVFFKDAHQIYRGCNAAFERFLGKPREDIVGKSVFEVAPPELAQRYFDQDQALLDNPPTQVYEAEVDTGEGRRIVVFHKATYMDERGDVSGIVGVILDITERRQAEDALRDALEQVSEASRSLKMASMALDSANEGIVVSRRTSEDDRDHHIVDVNDAFCRVTGHSREEMLGKSLTSLQSDAHSREFYDAAEESLRTTGRWKGEVVLGKADGTTFPAWLVLTVVRDEQGPGASIVGVFTDLSDLEKTQGRLTGG
jgi:PAS domain S-box-containing protein